MKKNIKPITRINADIHLGLTREQVNERAKNGYENTSHNKVEKSYARIIFDNFFNSFNVVLISIALIFLFFVIYLNATGNKEVADKYFGYSKFTFLLPVFLNSIIGTIQEINSKVILHKINIVNKAKNIVVRNGKEEQIISDDIVLDDIVHIQAGNQIVCDMILKDGNLEVDESLLTGESDLIKKGPGDTLLSGSSVIVGSGYGAVTKVGDETYASQLSDKVKKLSKQKSELMTSIYRLIRILAIVLIFIVIIVTSTMVYKVYRWGDDPSVWSEAGDSTYSLSSAATWARIVLTVGAFCIGIIPTGLVLLTSLTLAISIVRLAKQKTLIQDLFSLENLSRVDTICLDKTGTLTDGSMLVDHEILYIEKEKILSYIRQFNQVSTDCNQTAIALKEKYGTEEVKEATFEPFSSKVKSSSLHYSNGDTLTLGAPEYLLDIEGEEYQKVKEEASKGNRVLAFKNNDQLIALFVLKDNIRTSAKETIEYFYENNLDIKIISGDNPLTVSKIASQCSVRNTNKYISMEKVSIEEIPSLVEQYTIFARVSPEQKKAIIEALQQKGRKVGMTGDGVNDILALRKANASITFNKATDAAKACSDVVLMDDDFAHLKEVISQGRRVINNVQRTATLFLMKTVCFVLLTLLLIPFKKGQMWFSVENIYMMQNSVIAIGGFLLSLEGTKEPIKGTFRSNVLSKALLSGIFMTIGAIIPILLNQIPTFFGATPLVNSSNVSSMISILTTMAGFIVMFAMSYPHNRYRIIVFAIAVASAVILGFAFPTSFIGGKASTFSMFRSADGNFFHSQFIREIFQPWNCPSINSLNSQPLGCYLTLGLFLVIGGPLYFFLLDFTKKRASKKEK
jgi:cation-transporting P-type ATPase E